MSASSYPGVNVPPPLDKSQHQQCVEVTRSKIRCAIDSLQRALGVCIGIEVSEHETAYVLDQLFRAGGYIAQANYLAGLLNLGFSLGAQADPLDMSLAGIAERALVDERSAPKGGA